MPRLGSYTAKRAIVLCAVRPEIGPVQQGCTGRHMRPSRFSFLLSLRTVHAEGCCLLLLLGSMAHEGFAAKKPGRAATVCSAYLFPALLLFEFILLF